MEAQNPAEESSNLIDLDSLINPPLQNENLLHGEPGPSSELDQPLEAHDFNVPNPPYASSRRRNYSSVPTEECSGDSPFHDDQDYPALVEEIVHSSSPDIFSILEDPEPMSAYYDNPSPTSPLIDLSSFDEPDPPSEYDVLDTRSAAQNENAERLDQSSAYECSNPTLHCDQAKISSSTFKEPIEFSSSNSPEPSSSVLISEPSITSNSAHDAETSLVVFDQTGTSFAVLDQSGTPIVLYNQSGSSSSSQFEQAGIPSTEFARPGTPPAKVNQSETLTAEFPPPGPSSVKVDPPGPSPSSNDQPGSAPDALKKPGNAAAEFNRLVTSLGLDDNSESSLAEFDDDSSTGSPSKEIFRNVNISEIISAISISDLNDFNVEDGAEEEEIEEQEARKAGVLSKATNSSSVQAGNQTATGTVKKTKICSWCQQAFVKNFHLRRHEVIHTGAKMFRCNICNATFTRKDYATLHATRLHSAIRMFQCEVCGREFRLKNTLKVHMKVHEENKLHQCKFCEKGFPTIALLRQHMITHSEEKTHECDVCKARFVSLYRLNMHKPVHSEDKPHKCLDCGKTFAYKQSLYRHVARSCKNAII